ncbi:MAG: hypothetical protein ICV51_17475 [Flavisolibacter sp.]|nr:hypothetical protein [Flavisolibacter sp.]
MDTFLLNRQEYADAYEIPQFSDHPTIVFNSANELMEYLEQNKKEPHAIYWYSEEEAQLRGAMCLFTSDGQIILGLTCETLYPDTTIERSYLKSLMDLCSSAQGLIEYKTPAPRDTGEFLQRIAAQAHNSNF